MKKFISRNKYFGLIIFIMTTSFLYALYVQKNKNDITQTKPVLDSTKQAVYKSLTPGISNKNEVIEKLGNPYITDEIGNNLKYRSSNPEVPNEIVIDADIISIIKEVITHSDNKSIYDIEKEFGEFQYKLYGPHSASGFDLYVLPQNGIAYVGHKESGILLEIWYFIPTSFTDFKDKYAKPNQYSTSPTKKY